MRCFLALLMGLLLCAPASAEVRPVHPEGIPQQVAQCKLQPTVLWCIAREDSRARMMWTPKDDYPTDEWHSSASGVLADQAFADDCDGLSMTTVDLLERNGVPIDDLFLMLVSVEGKGVDHMVGAVKGVDGRLWIVGDAMMQGIYPADQMQWTILAIMPVSRGLWFVSSEGKALAL